MPLSAKSISSPSPTVAAVEEFLLLAELQLLRLGALKRRAKTAGMSVEQLDECEYDDDPKARVIELIIAAKFKDITILDPAEYTGNETVVVEQPDKEHTKIQCGCFVAEKSTAVESVANLAADEQTVRVEDSCCAEKREAMPRSRKPSQFRSPSPRRSLSKRRRPSTRRRPSSRLTKRKLIPCWFAYETKRKLIPCWFGRRCAREDCWYLHPFGRCIDEGEAVQQRRQGQGQVGRDRLAATAQEARKVVDATLQKQLNSLHLDAARLEVRVLRKKLKKAKQTVRELRKVASTVTLALHEPAPSTPANLRGNVTSIPPTPRPRFNPCKLERGIDMSGGRLEVLTTGSEVGDGNPV